MIFILVSDIHQNLSTSFVLFRFVLTFLNQCPNIWAQMNGAKAYLNSSINLLFTTVTVERNT